MVAATLDGKQLAQRVRNELSTRVASSGIVPGLAVILVGDDPASRIYVRNKDRAVADVGVATFDFRKPATTTQSELLDIVTEQNADPKIHGILVQLPLPAGIDENVILAAIDPGKDVDGFHAENIGLLAQGKPRFVAATPRGCMRLIAESGVNLRGAEAVVVGRSPNVGKPMAMLLTNADATVTLCHSRTQDLAKHISAADVLVAAVGRAEMIAGDWVKPGAVVIDVGINRGADGKLCGDVEFSRAAQRAAAITPVPGGVGPMTIA